jgi:hypothetical protein
MTPTQIEAAAAEFRDWLDGFPLTKTSKDLIAAKAAEIFGRKHAGEPGVTVEVKTEYCDRCDGCGWHEGGEAIQTTCKKCNGTGLIPLQHADHQVRSEM